MLTFLASPKPFLGSIGELQVRAIRSWLATHADAEVILYGDSVGCAELSQNEERIRHVPTIATSVYGVPLFDAIAEDADNRAKNDFLIYLNCDILMPSNAWLVLSRVAIDQFLVVGQRIDLSKGVVVPPEDIGNAEVIRRLGADALAELYLSSGVDYFCFKKHTWRDLAPLIIGRGGYDGALLAYCFRRRIPVIDATGSLVVLHQYHDHNHMKGGIAEARHGEEAEQNFKLHRIRRSQPRISDADYVLVSAKLIPSKCRGDVIRTVELHVRFRWGLETLSLPLRAVWRVLRKMGVIRCTERTLTDVLDQSASGAMPPRA